MIEKGEKLTLWCLDSTPRESQKRKHDEHADESLPKKRCDTSTVEVRRSQAKENEEKLKEVHKDKWTAFQYKLWAEMLVYGTHASFVKCHQLLQCSPETKNVVQATPKVTLTQL